MKDGTRQPVGLEAEALERIAGSLSDLYFILYEERALNARVSLTGNLLAFVFEDGLSVADEWLLRQGKDQRLREFREQFFEVVADEMVAVVANLTDLTVNYSFFGFDPGTRTTHAVFVLDLTLVDTAAERRAVLGWSEQVRRNAVRLRAEHVAAREKHQELKLSIREVRSESERKRNEGGAGA